MMSFHEAAKVIWNMSLWEQDGEAKDPDKQEAMLLAVWALMEQARFQDETSI